MITSMPWNRKIFLNKKWNILGLEMTISRFYYVFVYWIRSCWSSNHFAADLISKLLLLSVVKNHLYLYFLFSSSIIPVAMIYIGDQRYKNNRKNRTGYRNLMACPCKLNLNITINLGLIFPIWLTSNMVISFMDFITCCSYSVNIYYLL
jgi:hypothetical protein